ncbi:MAG: ferric reductase-like transmembrane domain-containing protein [Desulfobacterales bacterium]|nr:ferric reductase-like transmembrane domain-containing protein [Desulfobacterales bacterium]
MFYKFGVERAMLRAGKICGILAALLLLLQLLLTSRLKIINRFFALDSMAIQHKYNGMAVVGLLTAHAFLILVPEGLDNLPIGSEFWPEMVGAALYFFMLGLTLVSLFRDRMGMPHHIWLYLHKIGGFITVIFVIAHVRFVSESFETGPPEFAIYGLSALFLMFGVRRLVLFLFPPWHFEVISNEALNPTIQHMTLAKATGRPFDFLPGQFAFLRLAHPQTGVQAHPFSLSSSPDSSGKITFSIRSSGDWTGKIGRIPAGTKAYVDGPYGQFTHVHAHTAPAIILIAGGIGITPMLSMLQYMAQNNEQRPVHLIWSCRNLQDVVFQEALDKTARKLPRGKISYHLTGGPNGKGHLAGTHLDALLGEYPRNSAIFLCGPPFMTSAIRGHLTAVGFFKRNIHYEFFTL